MVRKSQLPWRGAVLTAILSQIYGFNVGMQIVPNTDSGTCDWYACDFVQNNCVRLAFFLSVHT